MTIKVTRLQNGGYTAQDDRNNNTAIMAKTAAVTARSGIIPSDGTDFAVTAQGTPDMTLNIAKGDLVVVDAAGGAYIFHMDATKVVTIGTAPGSGTRYDTIIARVYDNAAGDSQATSNITLPGSAGTQAVQTITGDIEVVPGTAGGSPSPPSPLPNSGARIVVLKVVHVRTSTTSILSGDLQDSQSTTSRIGFTAAAGGILHCRSSADYPATPSEGDYVDDAALNGLLRYNGSAWDPVTTDSGWQTLTLAGSWTAGTVTPQIRLIGHDVILRGNITGGATGSTFVTALATQYRPAAQAGLPATGNASPYGPAVLLVTTAGVASLFFASGGPAFNLDGVRWRND